MVACVKFQEPLEASKMLEEQRTSLGGYGDLICAISARLKPD
jgi:hypothetical protein